MPVISPSLLGTFAANDFGDYPDPPPNLSATVAFDFTGYHASDNLRAVLFSVGGESCQDSAGNSYDLDYSIGIIRVWSGLIQTMPVHGVDTVTVSGPCWSFTGHVMDGIDPVNFLGPATGTERTFSDEWSDPFRREFFNSGDITLDEVEDALFGVAVGGSLGVPAVLLPAHGIVGIASVDLPPDHVLPAWAGGNGMNGFSATPYPFLSALPLTGCALYRGEVRGMDPTGHVPAVGVGPWRFSGEWSYTRSAAGDPAQDIVTACCIIAYRGLGARGHGPTPPDTLGPGLVSALRHYTGRLFEFDVNDAGQLVQERYGDADDAPVESTLDSDPLCSSVAFWRVDDRIEGTYLRDTTPILARSTDHGATYRMTTLPGSYDGYASVPFRNRLVVLGFRTDTWYARVGKLLPDLSYSWSGEVAVSLTFTPNGQGFLRVEDDNTLTAHLQDTDSVTHLVRCHVLSLAAAGTWS